MLRATTILLALGLGIGLAACANRLPTAAGVPAATAAPSGGCTVIRTVTVKPPPSVSRHVTAPRTRTCPPVAQGPAWSATYLEPSCTDPCAGGRCAVPR